MGDQRLELNNGLVRECIALDEIANRVRGHHQSLMKYEEGTTRQASGAQGLWGPRPDGRGQMARGVVGPERLRAPTWGSARGGA